VTPCFSVLRDNAQTLIRTAMHQMQGVKKLLRSFGQYLQLAEALQYRTRVLEL
jgi:hypothetical protein